MQSSFDFRMDIACPIPPLLFQISPIYRRNQYTKSTPSLILNRDNSRAYLVVDLNCPHWLVGVKIYARRDLHIFPFNQFLAINESAS
jgi:hypothetical protein